MKTVWAGPRKERVYLSADKIIDDDENENEDFPAEVHNTLSVSGLPDHELKLKEGSLSLLETPRLSTFRLKEWNTGWLYWKWWTVGTQSGLRVLIPSIPMTDKSNELPFMIIRRHFSIKLAFGLTPQTR